MNNIKLKKLVKNTKRFAPAVITTVAVVTTVAVIAHYNGKTLLELTPAAALKLRVDRGGVLYETVYGNFMLMFVPTE